MKVKMEVREIDYKQKKIYCPFTNELVVDLDVDGEAVITPSNHLLFVAHDVGFEYRSPRLNQYFKEAHGIEEWDDTESYDLRTIDIEDIVMLEQYQPAPSLFGAYFGFLKSGAQ